MTRGTNRPVTTRAGQRGGSRPELPEWVRNPPPPRMTVGRRLALWADRVPGVRFARRTWSRWTQRTRITQRYPRTAQALAVLVAVIVTTLLVYGAWVALAVATHTGCGGPC